MVDSKIMLMIDYDIEHDELCFGGNLKAERRGDFILDFLRTQFGAGEDCLKVNETDLCSIDITCDLSFDIFSTKHNCGNLALRDGILMHAVRRLDGKNV